ncbi:hypothetical protein HDU96_002886 [Phlyctochytrium bullatum]|nr:hypothetical protein HDU96_002886 [Phlyctochytrium bullatum]
MAFTLALVRGGVACGLLAFLLWSLPGGLAMFLLGHFAATLGTAASIPVWVRHLQNGLSAVAVALVALAAVKMGSSLLTDNVDRALATSAAVAVIHFGQRQGWGVWVIPGAMVVGGVVTGGVDVWKAWREEASRRSERVSISGAGATGGRTSYGTLPPTATPATEPEAPTGRLSPLDTAEPAKPPAPAPAPPRAPTPTPAEEPTDPLHVPYGLTAGLTAITLAFILLAASALLRTSPTSPLPLQLLSTFYFSGMIIFGGGTVVVPLLYSYVVQGPHWLSDAEFLFGLALINTMPGPNFNFAAYCGALAMRGGGVGRAFAGAVLAWVGIYASGTVLMAGVLPVWSRVRGVHRVKAVFKGFSSVAVGLVFAATYILIEKAISPAPADPSTPPTCPPSTSLLASPFHVSLTAVAFVAVQYMKVPAPGAVLAGGVAGVLEWWSTSGH